MLTSSMIVQSTPKHSQTTILLGIYPKYETSSHSQTAGESTGNAEFNEIVQKDNQMDASATLSENQNQKDHLNISNSEPCHKLKTPSNCDEVVWDNRVIYVGGTSLNSSNLQTRNKSMRGTKYNHTVHKDNKLDDSVTLSKN